eukprot:gb/GECG01012442.1/.p1 GENE.gb/GECG01012442.1/~~gb/GECG01012442.1/.p1  ORF type:complete len:959 (+),score=85.48 gb/GECG01012442.1/:1-2877(+)
MRVASLTVPHAPFLERFLGSFAATPQAAIFAFQTRLIALLQEYLLSVNQRPTGSKHRELKVTFATILFVKLTEKLTALPLDRKFPILCRCSNGSPHCQLHSINPALIEAAKNSRPFDTLFGIDEVFAESEIPDLDSVHSDVSSPKQTKVWNFELHHDHGLTSYMEVKTEPLTNYNGLYSVIVWDQCSPRTSNPRDGPRKAVYLSGSLFKHFIEFLIEYMKSSEQHDLSFQTIIQLCRLLTRLPVNFEQQFEALLRTLVSHETMAKEINSAEATILSFDFGYQMLGGRQAANEQSFWQCVLNIQISTSKDIAAEFAPKLSVLRGLIAAAIHHSELCPSQTFFKNASHLLSELPFSSGCGTDNNRKSSTRNENHIVHTFKMLMGSLLRFPMFRRDKYTFDMFSLVERYRLRRENLESFIRSANEVFPYFCFVLNSKQWGMDRGTVEVMTTVVTRTLDCLLGSYVLNFPEERELETFLHGAAMVWSGEIRNLLVRASECRQWRINQTDIDGIALKLVQMAFLSDATPFFWNSVGKASTRRIAAPYALELGTSLLQTSIICSTSFSGYAVELQSRIARAAMLACASIHGGRGKSNGVIQSDMGLLLKDSELSYRIERENNDLSVIIRLEPLVTDDSSSACDILRKAWLDTSSALNSPGNSGQKIEAAALFWVRDTHFSSIQQRRHQRLMSLQLASAFLLKHIDPDSGVDLHKTYRDASKCSPSRVECALAGTQKGQPESNAEVWLSVIEQVYGMPKSTGPKPTSWDDVMNACFSMLFCIHEQHIPKVKDTQATKLAFMKTLRNQFPSSRDERMRLADVATSYLESTCPFLRTILHSFYVSEYLPMMYWMELRFLGHLSLSQYTWLHVLFLIHGRTIWSAALVTLLYQRVRSIVSKHTYINKDLTCGEFLQRICIPSEAYPSDLDGSMLLNVVHAMKIKERGTEPSCYNTNHASSVSEFQKTS